MAACHAHDVVIIGAAGHMTFYQARVLPAGDNNFGCEKSSTQQHSLKWGTESRPKMDQQALEVKALQKKH